MKECHTFEIIAALLVRKFLHIMEPKYSLPSSRDVVTFPYSESINLQHTLLLYILKMPFNIIIPSSYMYVSLRWPLCFTFANHIVAWSVSPASQVLTFTAVF